MGREEEKKKKRVQYSPSFLRISFLSLKSFVGLHAPHTVWLCRPERFTAFGSPGWGAPAEPDQCYSRIWSDVRKWVGAGKGSTANDIAHNQETHLAKFVENRRYTGAKPHKAVLPALICSRYGSSKKRGQLPAPELRERCQLTTRCDRQPPGSGRGLLSCEERLIERKGRKAPTPDNTYGWLPHKGKKGAGGREKQQQTAITEVIHPGMARARRLHSSTQATSAQARGSCSATPLPGENEARQRWSSEAFNIADGPANPLNLTRE